MKKITKRFAAWFLALAIVLTAVMAVPANASAASKPKSKKATLKITDTKLTGFKEIEGTMSISNKSVLVYGKNSANKNIYAYSTNGRTFSKPQLLGMDGNVYYTISEKSIYVFARDDNYQNTGCYKYAASVKDLAKASVIDFRKKISLPTGASSSDLHIYSYGYGVKGKCYVEAQLSSYINSNYVNYDYSIVLNGSSVTVTNLNELFEKELKENVSYVNLYRNYNSSSFKAIAYGECYDDTTYTRKTFAFLTSDAIKFTKIADIPAKDGESYDIDWLNSTPVAYRTYTFDEETHKTIHTVPQTSAGKGIFYMYSGGKWVQRTTSKGYSKGFFMGYQTDAYYYDGTTGKEYMVARYNRDDAVQLLYSKNGTSWSSLATLNKNKTAKSKNYTLSYVNINKTKTGTFAVERYRIPDVNNKAYIVISKLKGSKWTTLLAKTINTGEKAYNSTNIYGKTPTYIYNDGKTTTGYNLATGKSYKLPFKYTQNTIYSGDTQVFYYGKNLYSTKDGFKTITKITLKAGSKSLSKNITANAYGYIGKTSYCYLIAGTKMYYVTSSALTKIK